IEDVEPKIGMHSFPNLYRLRNRNVGSECAEGASQSVEAGRIAEWVGRWIRTALESLDVVKVIDTRIEALARRGRAPIVGEHIRPGGPRLQIVLIRAIGNAHWITALIEHEGAQVPAAEYTARKAICQHSLALAKGKIVAAGQLEHLRQIEHAVGLLIAAVELVLCIAVAVTGAHHAGDPRLGGVGVRQ